MVRQFAAAAVRTVVGDRHRHVGGAEGTAVFCVAERKRHFTPFGIVLVDIAPFAAEKLDRAAERVRVGNLHRAFASVDFNRSMTVFVDVEAGDHRDDRAALELNHAREVGRDVDRVAVVRLVGVLVGVGNFRTERPVVKTFCGDCGNALRRTEQVDECCAVVGTEVEHRTRAVVVEEGSLSPLFRTAAGDDRRTGKRLADPAVVEKFAGGLLSAAEVGVITF